MEQCAGCNSLLKVVGSYDKNKVTQDEDGRLVCLNCGTILDKYCDTDLVFGSTGIDRSTIKVPTEQEKPRGLASLESQLRKAVSLFNSNWLFDDTLYLFTKYNSTTNSKHKYGQKGLLHLYSCLFILLREQSNLSIGEFSSKLSVDKYKVGSCVKLISDKLKLEFREGNSYYWLDKYLFILRLEGQREVFIQMQDLITNQMNCISNMKILSITIISLFIGLEGIDKLVKQFSLDFGSISRLERKIKRLLPLLIDHLPWRNEVNDKNVKLYLPDILKYWKPIPTVESVDCASQVQFVSETESDIDDFIEREVLLTKDEIELKQKLLNHFYCK